MQQQQISDFLQPPQRILSAVASQLAWLVLQTEKKKKTKNMQLSKVFRSRDKAGPAESGSTAALCCAA